MADKHKAPPRGPDQARAASDLRTQLVKEQVARENAAFDARTARLRALRLAKEQADKEAAPPAPSGKTRRKP